SGSTKNCSAKPTEVPWGLSIAPQNGPVCFENETAFHPTFLYESLWDRGVVGRVIWAGHRFGSPADSCSLSTSWVTPPDTAGSDTCALMRSMTCSDCASRVDQHCGLSCRSG